MDHHDLAIDDGLTGNVEGTGNDGKPFDPIQTVPGERLAVVAINMELGAVAVYLISCSQPVPEGALPFNVAS